MSKKIKISKRIIKDYEKLVSEISEINGFIYHHIGIVKTYSSQVENWDRKITDRLVSGSRFHYRSPYDGKLVWGSYYKANRKNLSNKLKTISRSVINYYVSMAYEAFEKFLRTIRARIIINNKKEAQLVNEILGFSSYKSCVLLLQSQYRDNAKIISLLRRLNNDLDLAFRNHWQLDNFLHFYRVYSKCRNHIIHSNSLIPLAKLKDPKIEEAFAKDYFDVKPSKNNKYVIDTSKSYKKVLETIVSFAYLLISSFDSTFVK